MPTLTPGGNRRAVMPLTLTRRVRNQPDVPKLEEVEMSEEDIQNAARNRAAENATAQFQSAALEAATAQQSGAQMNEEMLELDRAHNANREESQVIAADQSKVALSDQFAPDRADISTFAALQNNPKYAENTPAELWEIARQQEGERNAGEFNRKVSTLPGQQSDEMAPMIAGLQQEGLDPQVFQFMLDSMNRGDDSIYQFTLEQRQAANRVVNGVQGANLNKSIQQMAAEGASEQELTKFMDAGHQETLGTKTVFPTWEKDDAGLKQWGDDANQRIIKNAQRLRGIEPGLTFEDAQDMAFQDLAENEEEFAGRFNAYEQLDAVTPGDLKPKEDAAPLITGNPLDLIKSVPETLKGPGEFADAIKADWNRVKGIAGIATGSQEVVDETLQPLLQLPLEVIRETGEATGEILTAAVRGDYNQVLDEFAEGGEGIARETVEGIQPIRQPVEAIIEITREAIQGDLDGLALEIQEAGDDVPQAGGVIKAWTGINAAFELEQEIVTPLTQPIIQRTLETFGVEEDTARGLSLFAAEILVPSTFVTGGAAIGLKGVKTAARLKKLLPIAMAEGSVNTLQNRAGKKTRGEPAPSHIEDALMFVGGFGAIFGLDYVTRTLGDKTTIVRQVLTYFGQESGGPGGRSFAQIGEGLAGEAVVDAAREAAGAATKGTTEALPQAVRAAIPAADEPGIVTMYHGTSADVGGSLKPGTNLTPNRADAQTFAEADARLTGGQPQVVEVRVREGATQPVGEDAGLARSRGAVEVVDPENAFVVPKDAPTSQVAASEVGGQPTVMERARSFGRDAVDTAKRGLATDEQGGGRLGGRGGDAENIRTPAQQRRIDQRQRAIDTPVRKTKLPSRGDFAGFAQADDQGRVHGSYFLTNDGRLVGEPGISHGEALALDPALREAVRTRNLESAGEALAQTDDASHAVALGHTRIATYEGQEGVEAAVEATSKAKLDEAVEQIRVDLPNAPIHYDIVAQGAQREVLENGLIPPPGRKTPGRAAPLGGGEEGDQALADFLASEKGAIALPADLSKSKPRFNIGNKKFTPEFESDLDRALYVVRNRKTLSKADDRFMEFLSEEFPNATDEELRSAGDLVAERIRKVADVSDSGAIEIPDTGARGLFADAELPNAGRGDGSPGTGVEAAPHSAGLDEAKVIPREVARESNPKTTTTKGHEDSVETDEFIDNARVASGGGGSVNDVPPTKIPGDDEFDSVGLLQDAAIQHKSTRASGESNAVAAGRDIEGLADRVLREETTQTAGVGIPQNPITAKVGLGGEQGKAKIRPGQIFEEAKKTLKTSKIVERLQRGTGNKRIITDQGDLSTSFGVTKVDPDDPMSADWRNVIENPKKFNVPKETQDMIDFYSLKVREMVDLMIEFDVPGAKAFAESGNYARRVVAEINGTTIRIGPKPGIGVRQGFEFARTRDMIKTGDDVIYDHSMAGSLELFIKETHQKIAGIEMARSLGVDGAEWVRVSDEAFGDPIRALEIIQTRQALKIRTLKTPKDIKANLNIANSAHQSAVERMTRLRQNLTEATRALNRSKPTKKRPGGKGHKGNQQRVDTLADDIEKQDEVIALTRINKDDAVKISAAARVKASRATPGEGSIREPIFGGKVIDQGAADTFQDAFGVRVKSREGAAGIPDNVAKGLQLVNTFQDPIRSVWANIDVSFMGLQTLAAMGKNPRGWAEVMGRTMGAALLDPKYRTEYFVKNREWVDRWRAGGGILHAGTTPLQPNVKVEGSILAPIFSGSGKKGIATPFKLSMDMWNNAIDMMNISTLKQVVQTAERNGVSMADLSAGYREGFPNIVQSSRGKGVLTTESGRGAVTDLKNLAKGEKPTVSKPTGVTVNENDDLAQIVASISHFGGQMTIPETARLGVKTNLALRALPFAGRYWLGWSKAIAATVTKGGYEGKVAREMFMGWMTAGVGMYSMAALAMGQTPNLNPRKSDFMTLTMFGQKVGVGGPLQQTLVLAGKLSKANTPREALDIQTRWLRGKSAPFMSMAADHLMKETFLGDPVQWNKIDQMVPWMASQFAPFTGQDIVFEGSRALVEGKGPVAAAGIAADTVPGSAVSGAGARGFPVSPFDIRDDKSRELFPEQDVDYNELLTSQKREVDAALPEVEESLDEEQARQRANEEVLNSAFAINEELNEKNIADLSRLAVMVNTGQINHSQFREGVGDMDMKARGQREVIAALLEQEGIGLDNDTQPHDGDNLNDLEQTQNDLWEYFQIFDKYPDADFDPDQKAEMFEEIDRFRSDVLTTPREDRMDAEIGIDKSTVRLYAELRKDRGDITDSGFFDLSEEAWKTLKERATIDLPATRGEFLDQLEKATAAKFAGQFGDLPPEALSVLYQNHPALTAYAAILEGSRTKFLRTNPAITELVLKWGYLSSSKTNLGIVGGTSLSPPTSPGGGGGGGGSPRDSFLASTGGGGPSSPRESFLAGTGSTERRGSPGDQFAGR